MSKKYQVVEKDDFGTDWSLVRYDDRAIMKFDTQDLALDAAIKYITDRNCNNALAKAEKKSATEVFMMTKKGCFLGILDGDEWYMTDRHGQHVDAKYFELQGKTQVAIREVPGT